MTISFDEKPFLDGKVVSDARASGLTMAGLAAYVLLIVLLMIYFGSR
jgi:tetrahydromethanopterin S-methyltransferase subunit F